MINTEKGINCDYCESDKPIKNVAMCWVEYDFYWEKQNWSKAPTLINDPMENKHLCEKCYEKWSEGDLF